MYYPLYIKRSQKLQMNQPAWKKAEIFFSKIEMYSHIAESAVFLVKGRLSAVTMHSSSSGSSSHFVL